MMQHMLIVGGSGVTGQGAIEAMNGGDWQVTTLSRARQGEGDASHLSADLLDPESLRTYGATLATVTHIFYAALKPSADPATEAQENGRMFQNLIEAVIAAGADLKRVIFLQGGKVYGAHLGVYKTPARENDSRHFPPNLYFEHEDYARTLPDRGIGWTALRPDIVIGHSLGSAMNLGNLIGVYGTLCKQLGVDMQFPGTSAAYQVLVNTTNARLLGEAVLWAANTDQDGAFNITNGDQFRWQHVWPKLADWFGLNVGEPQPINLQNRLNGACADVWRALASRHGLAVSNIDQFAQGAFGDFLFHVETDAVFDVTKARRAGFPGMTLHSDEDLIAHLEDMVRRRLIPDPASLV
jgi:nucleoside-diphosphate-sugar epimerase